MSHVFFYVDCCLDAGFQLDRRLKPSKLIVIRSSTFRLAGGLIYIIVVYTIQSNFFGSDETTTLYHIYRLQKRKSKSYSYTHYNNKKQLPSFGAGEAQWPHG